MQEQTNRILVLSTLFPSKARPKAGLFVRERMFRVADKTPLTVVSPVPWFPGQSLIRLFRPDYRPMPSLFEEQNGVQVFYPRFFALPYFFRQLDARMIALSCYLLIKRQRMQDIGVIDSHFTYPDGLAATMLGKWLRKPVTITMRGTEVRHAGTPRLRPKLIQALSGASRVFSVSTSLKNLAVNLGIDSSKVEVVGNGVDSTKFYPLDQSAMREKLGVPENSKILITVGGLVERKGFHRVIECLPDIVKRHPDIVYLIVGGSNPEGNFEPELRAMVKQLELEGNVRFVGERSPEQLKEVLSAANAFVLASSNEGWANVILEAMACGLPVIATDVGGNSEVVCDSAYGKIVPFGDKNALRYALDGALEQNWDTNKIIEYAKANSWDSRVTRLSSEFKLLMDS